MSSDTKTTKRIMVWKYIMRPVVGFILIERCTWIYGGEPTKQPFHIKFSVKIHFKKKRRLRRRRRKSTHTHKTKQNKTNRWKYVLFNTPLILCVSIACGGAVLLRPLPLWLPLVLLLRCRYIMLLLFLLRYNTLYYVCVRAYTLFVCTQTKSLALYLFYVLFFQCVCVCVVPLFVSPFSVCMLCLCTSECFAAHLWEPTHKLDLSHPFLLLFRTNDMCMQCIHSVTHTHTLSIDILVIQH